MPNVTLRVHHLEQTVIDLLGLDEFRFLDLRSRVVTEDFLLSFVSELSRIAMISSWNHMHVVSGAIAMVFKIKEDCSSEASGTSADYQDVNGFFSRCHFGDTSFDKVIGRKGLQE